MGIEAMVRAGLTSRPKSLSPVLFYDGAGSALFEEITRTPEYYVTRTEMGIFQEHARSILTRANGNGPLSIVELGAGSAHKTRVLLRELVRHQGSADYWPIDVSGDAILPQADLLEREIPRLAVHPIVGDNRAALRALPATGPARLIAFIGSSIGNLDPAEATTFLRELAAHMRPIDRILLGTDLVKDRAILHAAYNDAAGVTARFDLNVLVRLNRELGADFDLSAFEHRAHYNATLERIEMHLVSLREQRVRIRKLDLEVDFALGESIHTENSYKYTIPGVVALAQEAGLDVDTTWTDPERWFGVHLLRRRTG